MRGGFATLLALAAMAEGFTKPEKYVAFTGTGKIKQSGTKTWVVNGEFEVEAVTRNAAIKKARALHEKRHCYSFDGLPIKCELL